MIGEGGGATTHDLPLSAILDVAAYLPFGLSQ